MRRTSGFPRRPGVQIRVLDTATGKSISMTVRNGGFATVVAFVHRLLGSRYNVTDIHDRRHKRRS